MIKKIFLKSKLNIKNKIFFYQNKKIMHDTLSLKNSKIKKKVILIGTGKSALILDPRKISELKKNNYEVFSLGGFLSTNLSNEIQIDYYLLSDDRTIFPEKYDLDEKHKKRLTDTITQINKKNIKLFLPTSTYKKHKFKNKVFYFNNNADKFTDNISDITKYYGYSSISGIKALSICIFLGYEKIYMCGFDSNHWNNIKVNSNNEILQINRHFYDEETYLVNNNAGSVGDLLIKCGNIFHSYSKFKDYNIINLDPNSLVDIFKKKHNLDIYFK